VRCGEQGEGVRAARRRRRPQPGRAAAVSRPGVLARRVATDARPGRSSAHPRLRGLPWPSLSCRLERAAHRTRRKGRVRSRPASAQPAGKGAHMSPSPGFAPAVAASAILDHIRPGTDLIVQADNGEPVTVLDAIEAAAGQLERVTVHQALAVPDRGYHRGGFADRLPHVSSFPTAKLREHFERGTIDLMPNDLSRIPGILRERTRDPLLLVSVSPPDRHGYVSLGSSAVYAAALLG